MARRRPDPALQKARRLVRAGRRREAADVLTEALRLAPGNAKVKAELSRYLTGKPFTFEESDYKELQGIISDFLLHPQRFSSMRWGRLKQLRHRVFYLEQGVRHMLTVTDNKSLQQLHNTINRARQRHRTPISKLGISLAAGAVLLLTAGGTVFYLCKQAEKAVETMAAHSKGDFDAETARNLLKIYDTGLNRTLNRRVGEEADRLRQHLKATEQRFREIDAILREIETSRQSVVSQGVRRRAFIERNLKALGRNAGSLQERWATLCRREQKELNQQRLSLAEELMAPLPEWQELTGNPEEDTKLLAARLKVLQQRINIYDDAADALKLPEKIIDSTRQELKSNTSLQKEVKAYAAMLQLLPTARSYEQYKQLLENVAPTRYTTAMEMLDILPHMPVVDSVRSMMQEHGQNVPPGLLQAARSSLMNGQPTFSSDFPATREQLHLLNELLTNSALSTRLYELTNTADQQAAYSEELPVLRNGRACFNRSALDPQRDVCERKAVEWQNPDAVVSRILDPRPLHKALGMDNASGFSTVVNLPGILTRLLQHEHPHVPPLAKAYVFHYLLQVNNGSEHKLINGLRFAPEMRNTIRSFEKLRKECGVTLDGNCWLRRTETHAEAERRYADWFHKHRKADFAAELKKNLGSLLNVEPRFCGYINETGEAVLFEAVSKGQLIWHLSRSAMTSSVCGKPLQKPDLLSPVFIMKKLH